MLTTAALQAFVPVRDLDRATTFCRDTLGLRCDLSIPGLVSVFDAGGTTIRVTLVPEFTPYPFTQIGWSVPDIEAIVAALRAAGVSPLHYDGMTDELGIWTTPEATASPGSTTPKPTSCLSPNTPTRPHDFARSSRSSRSGRSTKPSHDMRA